MYDGTAELKNETAHLPDTIQVEIDKLMEDYAVDEYVPLSYTSFKNTKVNSVRFVIMTDGIKKPDAPEVMAEETAPQNLADRFVALFRRE